MPRREQENEKELLSVTLVKASYLLAPAAEDRLNSASGKGGVVTQT